MSDRPCLIFAHYFGGSARSWAPMIGALASDFECIVPDLPGFGGSRSLGGFPCLDSYAAMINALAPARPWIAVGHSMGGKIVLAAALLQPDKLAGLILIAPSPPTPEPMTDDARSRTIAAFGDLVAARAHFAAITDNTLTPAVFDACVHDELRVDRTAWDWWLKCGSRDDISSITATLDLPVFAVYEGVNHLRHPVPIEHAAANYAVLGIAFAIEAWSWLISFRQFDAARGDLGFYAAFRASKDPTSFMVLFENTAALLGLVVAAIGTWSAVELHQPMYDGIASIVIGLILGGTAVLLARESKSLLIGERADPRLARSILAIAAAEPFVTSANGLMTMQLSPDQIVAALSLQFSDERTILQVEDQVIALEQHVRAAHPEVVLLFVKPQTDKTYSAQRHNRFGDLAKNELKRRAGRMFGLRMPWRS